MLVQEVAGKYAQALFLATKDRNLIDTAYEQFNDLKAFLAEDKSLLNFLGAPQVLDEHKQALVRDVFSSRLEQLFVEFLIVLLEKKRVVYLTQIVDEFIELVENEKGIERVQVTTAQTLEESQKNQLIQKLAAKTGLEIVLEEKVDPAMIGGMIVVIEDQIIDGSVQYGLNMVAEQLGKVRVN